MTAELVLHLELDGFEVSNQKDTVKDLSGHNNAGELKGNVGIVADDAFGACANFDGDTKSYITVPSAQSLKITGDVTVEAWVYITKATTAWVRVIGKGTVDSRSYGLWYKMSSTTITTGTTITCLFQRGHGRPPFHDCEAVLNPATPLNTWYHLAGVVEGKKSSLYVHDLQGKLIAQRELVGAPSGALIDNDAHVTIGHAPSHAAHAGKVAQARIYKGSLSQAEIERDIGSDRLSLVPFRKSHPIDFRLNDDDDQPVLYIVDDSADAKVAIVKLELTNTSPQAINIPPLTSGASRDHHHFALRFHPGTLSASTIKKLTELTIANQATVLKEAADWELACLVGATGPVTLYLSYKGAKKPLQPQEQLTLTLHGVSADAGSGSRGTQVELLPHQLTYVGDDAPITGNRMRYIHITNHRGQKNIPLHVWLVDGNTVLNDGDSETTLKLRISNGSGDRDITLNEKSSKEASKFVISFDVGEAGEADWALTDRKNAKNVKIRHGGNELTKIDRGQGASSTFEEWELTFPQKRVLTKRGSKSSEHIEITLEGITTALSSGHANLYVRYERIAGYQDGQFILTVEKGPLVFDKKGNVAIGKPIGKEKEYTLDVAGTVVADKLSVSRDSKKRGGLFFAYPGDLNHAIYNNFSNLDGEGTWDGAKWNTFEGLNIRVGNRSAKPPTLRSALLINSKGHVGIGADLDIKKDLVSSLTINKKIAQDASYDYSAAPLSIFLPLDKHNGGSAPVGTEDILHLVREGVASAAYGNKVSLAIGRYENNGENSRTQLDIKLTDGPFKEHKPVLSLRSNGCVGIGTTSPAGQLEIAVTGYDDTPPLLVRGGETEYLKITAQGRRLTMAIPLVVDSWVSIRDHLQFYSDGLNMPSVGISSNGDSLTIVGVQRKDGSKSIKLSADTTVEGSLTVQGTFRVDRGMPIFNMSYLHDKYTRDVFVKELLENPNYSPGCFTILPCEEPENGKWNPVLLLKTSLTAVVVSSLWCEWRLIHTRAANGAISVNKP